MTRYLTPITDRSQADIDALTSKAFFNVADWLRIYSNAQVAKALVEYLTDHLTIPFTAVTTPTTATIPSVNDLNALLANINRIRVESGLPDIPGLDTLNEAWLAGNNAASPDYTDANEWERVIDIIYNSMQASVEYQVYCGVAAVGQPRFYQHRFRQYPYWVQPAVSPVRTIRMGFAGSGVGMTRNNSWRRYT